MNTLPPVNARQRLPEIQAGEKYGRLTVVRRAGTTMRGHRLWLCRCECGNRKIAHGERLKYGKVRSCGCLVIESARRKAEAKVTHGMARRGHRSPEFRTYCGARDRCNNPNVTGFAYYGGRGIKFRYESFEQFFADVGHRPPGLTLDRVDNNGDYRVGNCRWATRAEQVNNRRTTRRGGA